MNFRNDLKFGQIYEREFIKVMGLKSYEIDHETNKAIKEYDIIVKQNNNETKYEIKADRLSYKTETFVSKLLTKVNHRESQPPPATIGDIL